MASELSSGNIDHKTENTSDDEKPVSMKLARELYYQGDKEAAIAAFKEKADRYNAGKRKVLPKLAAVRAGVDFWDLRVSHKHKIAFSLIQKNACTSLSYAIYLAETGEDLSHFPDQHIHTYYQKMGVVTSLEPFEDYFKFAVIRDPIKRFISAFRNRALFHLDLEEMENPRGDLITEPDINYFIEKLDDYLARSQKLEMHTIPQCVYLNRRLDQMDAIYPIEEMSKLEEKLTEIIGEPFSLPRRQTGGPKISLADLTSASFEKLLSFYAEDYAFLSDYYSEAAIRREYETAISSQAKTT